MSAKRHVLDQLAHEELVALADRIGVRVHDHSGGEDLIDTITERGVRLHQILPALSSTRVADICRALGLEPPRAQGCVVTE
jgi:hypothetical protein